MTDDQIADQRTASIRETQDKTNHWLREMGFWFQGQTKPELMKLLAEFRRKSTPKPAGRDWARILVSRVADGFKPPIVVRDMATEALRIPSAGDDE